ncbi:S-layer homology domain-containing protein [Paenibacillus sp. HN-1]|uniref:LamG-like jellyroll fold domain-containing protein n=1 Tax=Paenibacillus TaxID=44249 RepID=UPI001CA8DE4B|nr:MULTISPECIES: LamG-like jellyroll fold domain-containing protein [Paenibacillus]MBY9080661.1 S-layer homology domain-containing protein [Paenibacillus sp. CGMCC 1.18879]MBY9085394.1 S-layer homology domain-containing protein [Paenibacillus sinensis]
MTRATNKFAAAILSAALLVPSWGLPASPASAASAGSAGQKVEAGPADYSGHWAQSDFQAWVQKGLIAGYGGGVYKPDQQITRGEWMALINRAFQFQSKSPVSFRDVAVGSKYEADIQKAVAAGYAGGHDDGTIRPEAPVSRQEAAVMLVRLFKLKEGSSSVLPSDAADLPSWSRSAVQTLLGEKYVNGYEDGSFKGSRSLTRAEALRMIDGIAGELFVSSGDYSGISARNAVIGAAGVSLKDAVIPGNLYVTEGVGDGTVLLDHVKIGGTLYVNGGGEHSVLLTDSSATAVVVNKAGGSVRIAAGGSTVVGDVYAHSGVKLEELSGLSGTGFGSVVVEGSLPAGSTVQLSGGFDHVRVNAAGQPQLYLSSGSIAQAALDSGSTIRVDAGTVIGSLSVGFDGIVVVQGGGTVNVDEGSRSRVRFEQAAVTASPASSVPEGSAAEPQPSASPEASAAPSQAPTPSAGETTPTPTPAGEATPAPTPTSAATPTPSAAASPSAAPAETPTPAPQFTNVSVHDPSIVKDNGVYYVFGSHIEAAKSSDLLNWTKFTNGYTTPGNVLFGDLPENLKVPFAWAGENDADSKGGYSVWAPDVFYNKDYVNADGSKGAYLMYFCTSSTYIRSAIAFAVSPNIEGPYTYAGTLVYSGFTKNSATDADSTVDKKWTNTNLSSLIGEGKLSGVNDSWFKSDGSYANSTYPNAIDPGLFYDKDGKLWMTYGSWSGGIFVLEIDPATGLAQYPGQDGKTSDGRLIDRYFGTKISGGYGQSGEGPFIVYDKNNGYYYLTVSYGGFAAGGGYDMRLFRSVNPDGPYVDALGQSAVLSSSKGLEDHGIKLIGDFLYSNLNAEADFPAYGYVSSGHNSLLIDDSGSMFNFFHSRFPYRGEAHEVRVHQMFMNEDGWPLPGPFRYAGEQADKVTVDEIAGSYQFVNHGKDIAESGIEPTVAVELNADGTVSGADVTGTWELKGDYYANLLLNETIDGIPVQSLYKGVFVKMWDPTRQSYVMAFTAMSDAGRVVWGSQIETLSDRQLAEHIANLINIGDTSKVYKNLTLPLEGVRNSVISWTSSNESIVSSDGTVNRPAAGSGDAVVELTAAVTVDSASVSKTFTLTVLQKSANPLEDGLIAAYDFESNLNEQAGRTGAGSITGGRIDAAGGDISYGTGVSGQAAVFNGDSGVRLPDGLIDGSAYTVSLWLNPDQLTAFTTAFFGAKTTNNWLSLLPYGNGTAHTLLWFGSDAWLSADSGLQIPAGSWSNVTFTYENGSVALYVNGVKKYTGTNFTNIFTDETGVFGLGVNYWDTPYKGKMDSLRVYERALSAEEAGWLVNGMPDLAVKVSSIALEASSRKLAAGVSYTPSASILPANAGDPSLVWSSDHPEIASADPVSGKVTGVSPGTAVITATAADGGGAAASFTVTVDNGEIAYYAFDGALNDSWSLAGEGASIGNRLNSSTVGSVTYGAGVKGQAAVFDGTSGIRLPDGLIEGNVYSVSMWLDPAALTAYTTTFFGAQTTDSWISFLPASGEGKTKLWSGTAWYDAETGIAIPANQWTHVVFTVNNGSVKVYINGVEKFSGTGFPDIFKNASARFGLGVNYWDTPYQGKIDELKIYRKALTAVEVQQEYSSVMIP